MSPSTPSSSRSSFGDYGFPRHGTTLPPPILTSSSRKSSFAGLNISTPTSPSFSNRIFYAPGHSPTPLSSPPLRPLHPGRRRSSNPIKYVRKRSKTALMFLVGLVVFTWWLLREDVASPRALVGIVGEYAAQGGRNVEGVRSGAFLKVGSEEKRLGRIAMKEMRDGLMGNMGHGPRRSPSSKHRSSETSAQNDVSSSTTDSSSSTPPPPLTPSQELSSLLLFLSSSSTNVLPPTIDPSQPINPDHVLSHTLPTHPVRRQAALEDMTKEAWELWPVVIVGKEKDPWMKEAKDLLMGEKYFGKKMEGLGIVYVDRRPDSHVLAPLLARLTRTPTLPSIIIGGTPIGHFEALKALHDTNKLAGLLHHAGAVLGKDFEERKLKERKAALGQRKQGQGKR